MMIHRLIPLLAVVCIFCTTSCEEERPLVLDVELQPYFERFQAQAALRGIAIDFEEMRIEGSLADLEGVGGKCEHNSVNPNIVLIDEAYWNQANDLAKEFIVFHELGHCALDRRHLETANPDGSCVSIMHSGTGSCEIVYDQDTREAYLDELFNE